MVIPKRFYFVRIFAAVIAALAFLSRAAFAAEPKPATIEHVTDNAVTISERYRTILLPSRFENTKAIVERANDFAKNLQPDGSWRDIDYKNDATMVWPASEHLARTLLLAKAAAISASKTSNDQKQLEAKALAALDWWLAHDPQNPNWWWNQIGTPQGLGEIGLFLNHRLSEKQREKIIAIMRRSTWQDGWTGQNLVWGVGNQIVRGCLEKNPATIAAAYARLYDEIRIARPRQDGLQADSSFHQHGPHLYSGGYGINFAQDVGRYIYCSWGTKNQISDDKLKLYSAYILDGQRWMMWRDVIDYSTVGREITTSGKIGVQHDWTGGPFSPEGAGYSIGHVVEMLGTLDTTRKQEFEAFANEMVPKAASSSPNSTAKLSSQPASIQPNDKNRYASFVGNKHFWRSDYMAHRRENFLFSIKMFSTRTKGAELVNDEGKKSHHLSDGVTMLYKSGNEYREIFPAWDWERIPGTTVEKSPDGNLDKLLPKGNSSLGTTRFVGGVSNGSIGLAAMDLRRGHLRARKSWLYLDDVIVCLGAGISCDSDNPVQTSVAQCYANGSVASLRGSNHVWHDRVGYLFPDKSQKFHADVQNQSGRWSDIGAGSEKLVTHKIFSITIEHGSRPVNGTYHYLIFPNISATDLVNRANHNDIQVLQNTADLQAIARTQVDPLFAAAFYQPAKIDTSLGFTLEVDQSCLCLLVRQKSGWALTISNPVNEPGTVNVKIADRDPIAVKLPEGLQAGSSVTVKVPDLK